MSITSFLGAILGGIGPALLWLWFWLREDSKHPEPRRLIALAFLAGMVAVAIVIPLEQIVQAYINANTIWIMQALAISAETLTFLAWSAIEELVKFFMAAITVLRRRDDDEPLDPIIYMVIVALGFAAAENTLFLLSPLSGSTMAQTIITGDYRFVGATLLHILASAVIGASMALAFYKSKLKKIRYITAGVILSILLHGLFNFLIMNTAPENMVRTFSVVWAGLIGLLAFLEVVKRMPVRRSVIK